jgi:hypothetical protein
MRPGNEEKEQIRIVLMLLCGREDPIIPGYPGFDAIESASGSWLGYPLSFRCYPATEYV